jgi:hypothetical protein
MAKCHILNVRRIVADDLMGRYRIQDCPSSLDVTLEHKIDGIPTVTRKSFKGVTIGIRL